MLYSSIYVVTKDPYGKHYEDKYDKNSIMEFAKYYAADVYSVTKGKKEELIERLISTALGQTYAKDKDWFFVNSEKYLEPKFHEFKEKCRSLTYEEFIKDPNTLVRMINDTHEIHIIYNGADYSLDNFMRYFSGQQFYIIDVFGYECYWRE